MGAIQRLVGRGHQRPLEWLRREGIYTNGADHDAGEHRARGGEKPGRKPLMELSYAGIDIHHEENKTLNDMLVAGEIDGRMTPRLAELHRAFLETLRRQVRFPHQDLEGVSEQLPASSPELSDHVDSSQVLPALARVDEVYQAAVALFYLEDCSYKEIAEILAVPVGTVRSRIARGIMQLRGILGFVEPEPASTSLSRAVDADASRCDSTGDAWAWASAA